MIIITSNNNSHKLWQLYILKNFFYLFLKYNKGINMLLCLPTYSFDIFLYSPL